MIKKILSIFAILGIATLLNAATLAEISKGVTYRNATEKWTEISANEASLAVIATAYNNAVAGTFDLATASEGGIALIKYYATYRIKTITSENAFIFVKYAPYYFINVASNEIFIEKLAGETGSKKAYMQIMRSYDIWSVDKTVINEDVYAIRYVKELVKTQGDKSNEDMLKTMVELATFFGSKGFTKAQAEASRQMAIYYAAIKALEITK